MFIHNLSPVALSLGPFDIRWYGLMYIIGIGGGWLLGRYRAKQSLRQNPANPWTPEDVDNLIAAAALGMLLGARLGYVLFYDLPYYLYSPLAIFKVWEGGMSFHGGLIGLMTAVLIFARHTKRTFFQVADFIAPLVPLGLLAGRVGNFINGELWGAITTSPLGVVFKGGGPLPRHPSQLYEAGLEGLLLGIVLWVYSGKYPQSGRVSGLFLAGYGFLRFCIEFVRQPDAQLGYLAFGWLTMGQVLCLPMIALGLYWLLRRSSAQKTLSRAKPGQPKTVASRAKKRA